MKQVITLTKMLSIAVLMLTAVVSFASPIIGGDKDGKCKHDCCKAKVSKEVKEAMKELGVAMKELAVQIKAVAVSDVEIEVTESVAVAPSKIKKVKHIISAEPSCKDSEVKDQKINFTELNKEMEKVQEDMTQMDSCLQKDNAKSRKAAEDMLKTGIKA